MSCHAGWGVLAVSNSRGRNISGHPLITKDGSTSGKPKKEEKGEQQPSPGKGISTQYNGE